MIKLKLTELVDNFDFSFARDNYIQWLTTHKKDMAWFFHRHEDVLLSVLQFADGKAITVKIYSSGELVCSAQDKTKCHRALAFLHILMNDELPYEWEEEGDPKAAKRVIHSFTGSAPIAFTGAIMDLEGETSDEMDRLFKLHGKVDTTEYHIVENYLFNAFLLRSKSPYPALVLSKDAHRRFYSFFNDHLNRRRGPSFSQMESCYFAFSDNTLVSLQDIFFHPYSALIDPEFFETLDMDATTVDFNPYQFLGLYSHRQENIFVKNTMAQVLERELELELAVELYERKTLVIPVKGFDDPSSYQTSWSLTKEDGTLMLSCRPFEARNRSFYLGHGSFYDFKSQHLFRNRIAEEFSYWGASEKDLTPGEIKIPLPSVMDPDDIVYKVETFNRRFDQNLELKVAKVGAEEITVVIDLPRKTVEQLCFSLKWKNKWISLPTNFPTIFNCLSEGLGAYFWENNSDLAQKARGPKRQNGLKLLRHAGFFHLLFHLSVKAKQGQMSEKNVMDEAKKLAIATVLKIPEENPKKIGEIWSREFGNKISKTLSRFINTFCFPESREHFFEADGELYDAQIGPVMERLHYYLSDLLLESLDETVLAKQRFKDFSVVPAGALANETVIHLKNAFEGLLLTEPREGIEILFEGESLQTLGEQDVGALFKIEESKSAIDWFELHPEVFFKGKRVAKAEDIIFHGPGCVEHQGQFYLIPKKTLPKVKWLDYFWKRLASKKSGKKFSWEGKIEHIPKNQTLELLAMREAGIPVKGGERWQEILDAFDKLKSRLPWDDELNIPGFKVPLKQFQRTGTQWMLDLAEIGLGGVLADDMGLGKTIQSIGALEWLRLKGKMGHCLVIVPTSLTYNWMSEVEKFAPEMPCFNFSTQTQDDHEKFLKANPHSLTVITYGLFARNCKNLENCAQWNIALFDEAQNLKNITATRTGYARKFPSNVKFCLTGTPMENHYGEFYSLIDLVAPGALGSYAEFLKVYNFKASKGVNFEKLEQDVQYLRMKTAPLVMRRTKEKILSELPEKSEVTIKLEFEKRQEQIYRDIAIAYNKKIKEVVDQRGSSKSQLEILSAILRLRQACSYPDALPQVNYDKTPPKIATLVEQVEQIAQEGHKLLIFTNFKSTLGAIGWHLEKAGVRCFSISGGTTKKKRESILKSFEEHEGAAALAMTLKTGGVGLNLTSASYVFHIEPWWNPAAENQATDRAHRMGQKNKVQVYRYIMKDSIEEKIEMLKQRKSLAIDGLLSEKVDGLSPSTYAKSGLTYEDFQFLLS